MKSPMKALSDLCVLINSSCDGNSDLSVIREAASKAAREANTGFTVISYGEDGEPDPRSYVNATTPEQAAEFARLENGGLEVHGVYPGAIGFRADLQQTEEEPRFYLRLTGTEEFNTILAALRFYQESGMGDPFNRSGAIHDIATNGGEDISLDYDAIDALCERLNTDDFVEVQ